MKKYYRSVAILIITAGVLWGAAGCSTAPEVPAVMVPVQVTPAAVYQAVARREFGTESEALDAVAKQIADVKPAQYAPIELQLIWVLQNPQSTVPGKEFACRMLRIVGSPACVPSVGRLLSDEKLSAPARNVLLGMHDSSADRALHAALALTSGKVQIGIINTLGDRQDRKAVALLAALLSSSDDATTQAIFNALGKIGDAGAADALDRAKVPGTLAAVWADAYVRCADEVATGGQSGHADTMYHKILDGDYPTEAKSGALIGVARIEKEKAVPEILHALESTDFAMHGAAGMAVVVVPGNAATRALGEALAKLDAKNKIALVVALSSRGDAAGLTGSINAMAAGDDADVREAATFALARLGDASSVSVLAAALKTSGGESSAARQTLVNLEGPGVIDALVKQAQSGDAAVRQEVMAVLVERHQGEALPALRAAVHDGDAGVRRAAIKAVGSLGAPEDFSQLLTMLLAAQDHGEQDAIADAMSNIARRSDKGPLCNEILAVFPHANGEVNQRLLNVLAVLGGEKALLAARAGLASEGDVRRTAVRVLANWTDAAPMADLLAVAKDDKDQGNKILALQGYIRMVGQTGDAAHKIQAYRDAAALAVRPDEKRQVLAGLADVSSVDALKMVEGYLADSAVQNEAYNAYAKIAEALRGHDPAVAKEALNRVAEKAPDGGLRERAKRAAEKIK